MLLSSLFPLRITPQLALTGQWSVCTQEDINIYDQSLSPLKEAEISTFFYFNGSVLTVD